MTTAGRSFAANRGQAVSLVQLGYAGFEGFFPLMAVALMAYIGWQTSWFVFAAVLVLLAVPLQLNLSAAEPKNIHDDAQAILRRHQRTVATCCATGVFIW